MVNGLPLASTPATETVILQCVRRTNCCSSSEPGESTVSVAMCNNQSELLHGPMCEYHSYGNCSSVCCPLTTAVNELQLATQTMTDRNYQSCDVEEEVVRH